MTSELELDVSNRWTEYGMEQWNGKWNGTIIVHSDICLVWLALFNLVPYYCFTYLFTLFFKHDNHNMHHNIGGTKLPVGYFVWGVKIY